MGPGLGVRQTLSPCWLGAFHGRNQRHHGWCFHGFHGWANDMWLHQGNSKGLPTVHHCVPGPLLPTGAVGVRGLRVLRGAPLHIRDVAQPPGLGGLVLWPTLLGFFMPGEVCLFLEIVGVTWAFPAQQPALTAAAAA